MSTAHDRRDALFAEIQHRLPDGRRFTRVGVDGIDCAGKTTFADAFAGYLRSGGHNVVRISVDDFHHTRAVRYRQGDSSADGFYEDAFDYRRLRDYVLDPLSDTGHGSYRAKAHDLATDALAECESLQALPGSIVVVDGLFLHRPEIASYWDVTVLLDVPFEVGVRRMATRDGTPDDVADAAVQRYVGAQRRYFDECAPRSRATFTVDNSDPTDPRW